MPKHGLTCDDIAVTDNVGYRSGVVKTRSDLRLYSNGGSDLTERNGMSIVARPPAYYYCSTLAAHTKFSMRPLYFQSLVVHAPLVKYAPAAKGDGMSTIVRVDVSV